MTSARSTPVSDDTRLAVDALRRIVRALRTPETAQGELTAARLFVLQTLAEAGTLSVNEIAARTHAHQSSVSVVVKRLAQMRLVRRVRAEDDARRVELSLTTRGAARLRHAPRAPQERLVAGIESLSPAERSRLAASLSGLVRAMRIDGERPAMFFEDEPEPGSVRRSSRART